MGLPGSGKTTLASKLKPLLNAKWVNADKVRTEANDWDFSSAGRIRQAPNKEGTPKQGSKPIFIFWVILLKN